MKRLNKLICIGMVTAVICSGCGNSNTGRNIKNNNSVDAVIQNEMEKSSQEEVQTEATQSTSEEVTSQDVVDEQEIDNTTEDTTEETSEEKAEDINVDIDISVMSSDMVYATVYQLVSEPDKYVGQIIKIKGNHYSAYYDATDLTYHYALIQDATACCAQGLEFELANGLEYPDENEEITVIGTFETYEEEGYLYCTLKNAIIQ